MLVFLHIFFLEQEFPVKMHNMVDGDVQIAIEIEPRLVVVAQKEENPEVANPLLAVQQQLQGQWQGQLQHLQRPMQHMDTMYQKVCASIVCSWCTGLFDFVCLGSLV